MFAGTKSGNIIMKQVMFKNLIFGTIFKKSKPDIHVGSKCRDVLSKGVWAFGGTIYNEISLSKTIL